MRTTPPTQHNGETPSFKNSTSSGAGCRAAAASCLPLLRTVQSTPREYVVAPALYASTSSTACPRNGQWRPASHEAGGKDEASGQESLDHWLGPVNEIRDDPSGTRGEGMCLCTALI